MKEFIGCDYHRRYSVFVGVDESGTAGEPVRVEHIDDEFRNYVQSLPPGTPIAVEATGGCYWAINELEQAGLDARLAQPFAAKRMAGGGNQTDTIDARAIATMLRNGTLPQVWIPDARTRDLRHLVRARLYLRNTQTRLKARIVSTLNSYGLRDYDDDCDLFHGRGRVRLSVYIGRLPEHTRESVTREWQIADELERQLDDFHERISKRIGSIGWCRRLKTLPGVGEVLGATIYTEIGDVKRFRSAQHLASYAGLVPIVRASGGRTWLGPTSPRSNHYLRWAFVEAANAIVAQQKRREGQHVIELYRRVKASTKCHNKAAVALARHLAESSWWILTKAQDYRPPRPVAAAVASSRNG
jgi:transposase